MTNIFNIGIALMLSIRPVRTVDPIDTQANSVDQNIERDFSAAAVACGVPTGNYLQGVREPAATLNVKARWVLIRTNRPPATVSCLAQWSKNHGLSVAYRR